jgi:hypothetical protein
MEPKVHTTLPKVDKVDASSVVAPTVLPLLARPGSKAPNYTPIDDDPNLLNFAMAASWIASWMSCEPQRYWPNLGKPDGPVFALTYIGHAFPVLSHEDVESGLWARLWLGPLIFLPLSIFWTFGFHHPRLPFLSYGNLIPFSRLGLRWSNHDLLPFELDHVHICQERVFVELHLGTFNKFQSSFIYG